MSNIEIPSRLPILISTDNVLLPGSTLRISVRTLKNINLVKSRLLNNNSLSNIIIGIVPLKPDTTEEQVPNMCLIGTAAIVSQVFGTNWPRHSYTILCTGLCRFRVEGFLQETPYYMASVSQLDYLEGTEALNSEIQSLSTNLKKQAIILIELLALTQPTLMRFKKMIQDVSTEQLSDIMASIVRSTFEEKLDILNSFEIEEKLRKILPLILRQIETLKLMSKNGVTNLIMLPKNQSSGFSKYLNESTSNDDDDDDIVRDFEKKIKALGMSEAIERSTLKELKRLKSISPMMPEYAMLRTYLELMVELPWNKSSESIMDIKKARNDIELDHYGLDRVKKRVIEFLAVKQIKNSLRGPILCFVGPPGVGKTSIGKSIAAALGRKFHRISLGGICDQSDIRGHRRTYIGSMPGRIIHGLKVVKVNNPVFLLDEIDKLTRGIHGDPSASLLEALDPEQNFSFVDHYLNVPFDLSQVIFIATANDVQTIPQPLLDRMEIIEVPGYTLNEKVEIAKRHLVPKQVEENGLIGVGVVFADEAIGFLISGYTREAGVRQLERKLAAICRNLAVKIAENLEIETASFNIDCKVIEEILGTPIYQDDLKDRLNQPGVAIGLAWTPVGGEIMIVEAIQMVGEGRLTLTGQLGEVMKESAELALSWLRSNANKLGIQSSLSDERLLQSTDIHVHFPAGAVSKDGPSAGVTIATVLLSLVTGCQVRSDTAMTGEITLRGIVLPVGGIKEKVLAAHRNGLMRVIIPKQNEKDLKDIPENIYREMSFVLVQNLEEVIRAAFENNFMFLETDNNCILSKL